MIGPFIAEEIDIVAQAIREAFLRGKIIKEWDKLFPRQRQPYLDEAKAALHALDDYREQQRVSNDLYFDL